MVITFLTKPGGREINEDAIGKTKAKGIVCVVIADGLGGHNGGKLASETAVETVLECFRNTPGFSKEHLKKYIEAANEKIVSIAKEDPQLIHMSSTVVVLLIKGRRAIWANVGDSRLYRLSRGEICEVTEDNSIAFLNFVRGDIEYNDIRTSPDQNMLTSALGVMMDTVNYSEERRIDGSTSFLLCTDGWWEYITEDEMEESFRSNSNSRDCLGAMLKIREENAPENSDNFTAAIISF